MAKLWPIIRMVAVGLLDISGRTDYARLAPPFPKLPDIPTPSSFKSDEEVDAWYNRRRLTVDNLWEKDKVERDRYWKTVAVAQVAVFAAAIAAIGLAIVVVSNRENENLR